MFDMNKIGKKISSLRKEKGITQMELADKLGISFQAVSNWERGNTMPDISKLPELAEIFGVTIEELLGDERKGKIVEEVANGDMSNVKAEDLADIAPIVSNEQFKQAYEQADEQGNGIDIDTLVQIAPFLDEDVLYEFVKNNLGKGAKIGELVELAPFMAEDDLGKLVTECVDNEVTIDEIVAIAPFLEEKDVGKIAKKYLAKGTTIGELSSLAPFMDEDDLSELVTTCITDTSNFGEIAAIAPFMNEDDLTEIARKYLNNGGSFNDIMSIAPFLDMNKLFKEFYKK